MIRAKQSNSKFPPLKKREDLLEKMADYVLMTGSSIGIALTVIGSVLFEVNSIDKFPHIIGKSFHAVLESAIEFQGTGITNLGIFILMATPFLRVITCMIGFSLLRWWRFTFVSLVVLGILIVSMYHGR